MTRNTKKIVLFNIALLLIVGAVIGYYMYNKGPVDVKSSKGIEATPNELYTSYTKDSIAAHKKYDDKVLKVTGEVTEISQNTQKQQIILIKTSSEGGYINCTMEESVPNVKAGDTITIKGICNGIGQGDPDLGILGDVYLTRSFISK